VGIIVNEIFAIRIHKWLDSNADVVGMLLKLKISLIMGAVKWRCLKVKKQMAEIFFSAICYN
jgi:hypothetical protein